LEGSFTFHANCTSTIFNYPSMCIQDLISRDTL
jgi:hypothetical protein